MPKYAKLYDRAARGWLLAFVILFALTVSVSAQTTAFTYQGKLSDNGSPASGQYDLQFKLFDTATVGTGTQQGGTLTVSNVTVTGGVFTVNLDFGSCAPCFNGAARYLEIAVKATSTGTFTTLGPRQAVSPTPYALRSQIATTADNALQLNGTSFNISGNGTAGGTLTGNIVNTATQYNVNGTRALTINGAFDNAGTPIAGTNTFTGEGAGLNTTPDPDPTSVNGRFNSFYGLNTGKANTTGHDNAFFGINAGFSNTTGYYNAFFGNNAGLNNIYGFGNSFFGESAGSLANQANGNSFFGYEAGYDTTFGGSNVFIGAGAGHGNTGGMQNTMIGAAAQFSGVNSTGSINTALGYASIVNGSLTNATAIGARAQVAQSNSIVLGSINGINNATADTSVGIGTSAPAARLHVIGNWNGQHGALTLGGDKPTIRFSGGAAAGSQQWMLHLGSDGPGSLEFFNGGTTGTWGPVLTMTPSGAVGIGTTTPADTLQVFGNLRVGFGTNGCVKDADGTVIAGTCSSDIRLKRDIAPFADMLDKVAKLQPVTFYWRADEYKERHFGARQSFGLIAQDVEKVLPELVTEDGQGYKAVNYSKLSLLAIQAIKELRAENNALKQTITQQEQRLNNQQVQIDALKQLVCKSAPDTVLCKQ